MTKVTSSKKRVNKLFQFYFFFIFHFFNNLCSIILFCRLTSDDIKTVYKYSTISNIQHFTMFNHLFLSFICFCRRRPSSLIQSKRPGPVAQSVTCLTADPGVASSIPARSHTFVEIDHEIISTVILLPSADSFNKGCCQLQAKVCAQITG